MFNDSFDCGELSDVVIKLDPLSLYDIYPLDLTINGTVQQMVMEKGVPIDFFCSGTLLLESYVPISVFNVLISAVNVGLFSENLLMGLAGVICASLLAYVLVKYAV